MAPSAMTPNAHIQCIYCKTYVWAGISVRAQPHIARQTPLALALVSWPYSSVDKAPGIHLGVAGLNPALIAFSITMTTGHSPGTGITTSGTEGSPILPLSSADGLIYSQQLFSLTTNIDPHSLVIHKDKEFYLFMDLHAEYKWVLHKMTPKIWVEAATEYNKCLISKQGPSVMMKNLLMLL